MYKCCKLHTQYYYTRKLILDLVYISVRSIGSNGLGSEIKYYMPMRNCIENILCLQ